MRENLEKIEKIKKEYEEILNQLSNPDVIFNFEELLKRKGFLEKIIEKEKEIKEVERKIEENKSIISAQEDPELITLAETEILELKEQEKRLIKELENLLSEELNRKVTPLSPKAVIVEIRAGAGGEEAALFAADLFRMYSKYADSKNWKKTVLDCHYSDLGGIKQIIFELKDSDVFSKMSFEAGVHRVQRIPVTEKSGRIHTSTASVAVLPKPQKGRITINPQHLKIETYKASGPGGQYVNKRMTAVRITHLPSGMVITSQSARSLQQNKENAMTILEAKLQQRQEMKELEKLEARRKAQIKSAQRAEKIRTYNFPQNRVTDHRLQKKFHNLDEIMEGKLEPLIQALQKSISSAY